MTNVLSRGTTKTKMSTGSARQVLNIRSALGSIKVLGCYNTFPQTETNPNELRPPMSMSIKFTLKLEPVRAHNLIDNTETNHKYRSVKSICFRVEHHNSDHNSIQNTLPHVVPWGLGLTKSRQATLCPYFTASCQKKKIVTTLNYAKCIAVTCNQ
jgi:hypothetical protein